MTKRKHGKIYDKWHRRVEGQIRHTMNCHPEYFNLNSSSARKDCINSLAKRIVGEIVKTVSIYFRQVDVGIPPTVSTEDGARAIRKVPKKRIDGMNVPGMSAGYERDPEECAQACAVAWSLKPAEEMPKDELMSVLRDMIFANGMAEIRGTSEDERIEDAWHALCEVATVRRK